MKLTLITKPLRSVQVRVTVTGQLNAALQNYAGYYEHIHGDPVEPRALIPEMLRAFIEADREFQAWSSSRSDGRQHDVGAAPSASADAAIRQSCLYLRSGLGQRRRSDTVLAAIGAGM